MGNHTVFPRAFLHVSSCVFMPLLRVTANDIVLLYWYCCVVLTVLQVPTGQLAHGAAFNG
jgi:hypothetical protein